MIKKNVYKLFVFFIWIVVFFNIGTGHPQKVNSASKGDLSINLKSQAVVVGPTIKLGDICYVVLTDSLKRAKIASVEVGVAPPPGESSEISLNHIKQCLKKAGFGDLISYVKGPNIIRITTAQEEIDKAFLKDVYAQYKPFLIEHSNLNT